MFFFESWRKNKNKIWNVRFGIETVYYIFVTRSYHKNVAEIDYTAFDDDVCC